MQTETRPVTSPLDMGPTGFLSLALSALRLSTPTRIVHPRERIISLEEVSWHDNEKDCWVVIYDRVYDLTNFDMHPGGREVLIECAGRDATIAFRGVGHSKAAIRALDHYLVGELPTHERIFRTSGGISISEIPA